MNITYFNKPYTKGLGKTRKFTSKEELITFFREKRTELEGYAPRTFRGGVRKNNTCLAVYGVVIDYDNASPFSNINEALEKIPFFSIIYTTKSFDKKEPNKRFHVFVPFAKPEASQSNESLFVNILKELGIKGADLSVKDKARFLHLPLEDAQVIADPTLDYIDASEFIASASVEPEEINSRHEKILKFVRAEVDEHPIVNEELLSKINNYIKDNISEPALFLSGKRKEEVKRMIKDCFKYKASIQQDIKDFKLPEKTLEVSEQVHDLFLYKDVDFLNVKGLVGRVTREFYKMAMYPCPKCCFFSALSLVSFLKHKSVFYSDGMDNLRSCTNIMLFARSGFSKSLYLNLVRNTVKELGLLSHVSSKIGSQQGGEDLVSEKESVLFLIDEFAKYMTSLKGSDLNHAQRGIKEFLLEIITATGQSYITTQTRGNRSKIIHDPNISTFGLGVTKDMGSCFSAQEFSEGLVTRFLIIQSDVEKKKQNPKKTMSFEVMDELKDLVEKGFYGKKKRLTELKKKLAHEQASAGRKDLEEQERNDYLQASIALQGEIEVLLGELQAPEITFAKPIQADIETFEEKVLEIENKYGVDKTSGKGVVASRIIEHTKRLICTLEPENANWVIKLMQSYLIDLGKAYDLLCMSEDGQLADKILNSTVSICKSRKSKGVSLGVLLKNYKYLSAFDFKKEVLPALEVLEAKEQLEIVKKKGNKFFLKISN